MKRHKTTRREFIKTASLTGASFALTPALLSAQELRTVQQKTYDYIIVGGGSAGGALTGRLAANPDTSVLLLEAGADWTSQEAPEDLRTLNFMKLLSSGTFQWPDLMANLTPAKAPEHYIQGKALGGGSAINGLIWARPNLSFFDQWEASGATGWNAQSVLPHFIRSETDLQYGDQAYHGSQGPVPIWRPDREAFGGVDLAAEQAARQAGFSYVDDMNAPEATGLSRVTYNVRDGRRITINDAYLQPMREQENLTILGDTLVDNVIFDGKTAVGVRTLVGGEAQEFRGNRIILSAGAIFTPGILMRSGVGPQTQLKSLEVPVVADRPGVGFNLQDHAMLSVTFTIKEAYRKESTDGLLHGVFLRCTSDHPDAQRNDLLIGPQNYIGTKPEALSNGGVIASLMAPYSRGNVIVNSKDSQQMPIIQVNMLTDRRDIERMSQGVRTLFELGAAQRVPKDRRR